MVEGVKLNRGGKGAKIRRRTDEGIDQVCECLYNLDVSRGCIAQVPVQMLLEVYENGGSYSPERTKSCKDSGHLLPDERCDYCYAVGNNSGNVLPRRVDQNTRKAFSEYSPEFIRLGKSSEPGHPYFWKTLEEVLNLCGEFRTKIIFPTKMLPYGIEGAEEASEQVAEIARKVGLPSGRDIADKLKWVGGSLMYSLGYDSMEPGQVSQGFTNQWRITQAQRYHFTGVNTSLTVVCDVTSSIEDNVARGAMVEEAIRAREESKINVRILPIRFLSRKSVKKATEKSWEEIKSNGGIFLFEELQKEEASRPYMKVKKSHKELIPKFMHPDFLKLLEEGFGFCGRVGDIEYCDKCHLPGMERERIEFPVSELEPLPYDGPTRDFWKKRKKVKKSKDPKLF